MFLDDQHRKRYESYIAKDNTHEKDNERRALFLILSGCRCLSERNIDQFYDFKSHVIRSSAADDTTLSSGARVMLRLAFNLYNNYPCPMPSDVFAPLDHRNSLLALSAIQLRFGI